MMLITVVCGCLAVKPGRVLRQWHRYRINQESSYTTYLEDSHSKRFFQLPPRARRQRWRRGAGATGGARGGTILTSPSEELLPSSDDPLSLDKDRRLPKGAPLTVAKFSSQATLKVSKGIPSGSVFLLLLTENVLLKPLARPSAIFFFGFGTSSELITVISSKSCGSYVL